MLTVSTFLSDKVETNLGSRNYAQLLEDVCKPESIPHILNEGMDLITKLCENGLGFAEDEDSISAVNKCLQYVVHNYKPKESLICLLEQGERLVNSDKFTYLLPSMQFVMLNLPKKREKTFSWVLSILKSHIKYHSVVPEELKASMAEKKNSENLLFEQDPRIKAILQTYEEYLEFYTPFVEELDAGWAAAVASKDEESIGSIKRQRNYLRDYLVDLLGMPLIHFDLDWKVGVEVANNEQQQQPGPSSSSNSNNNPISKIKTDGRLIAEKFMNLLMKVDPCPLDFLQWIESRMKIVNHPKLPKKKKENMENGDTHSGMDVEANDSNDEDDEDQDQEEVVVHMSSLVTYLYLVFDQRLPVKKLASVYSPTFMFNTILYPVSTVLKNPGNIQALLKAIRLATRIISLCDNSPRPDGDFQYSHRFHADLLKTDIHTIFIERIFYLAIYCQDETVRHEAYILYKQYLMTFDPQGKHDLIQYIVNTIPCDSLVGHMIMELKQFIHVAADENDPNFEWGMDDYFLGPCGTRLISSVCKLKNGVTTDLCEHSNQIIASLNFLRFLLLRDKRDGKIGIRQLFPKIEESLLNPLRTGLDLSKAHFQLKLKELQDPHLQKERDSQEKRMFEDLKCDVNIGDKKMMPGDISSKEQKSAVINSLNTFDHMTGLLAWVYEAHNNSNPCNHHSS